MICAYLPCGKPVPKGRRRFCCDAHCEDAKRLQRGVQTSPTCLYCHRPNPGKRFRYCRPAHATAYRFLTMPEAKRQARYAYFREYGRQRRLTHGEMLRERQRTWYRAHPDQARADWRARWARRKDEINARRRARRAQRLSEAI